MKRVNGTKDSRMDRVTFVEESLHTNFRKLNKMHKDHGK